jgi:hypothetical protein
MNDIFVLFCFFNKFMENFEHALYTIFNNGVLLVNNAYCQPGFIENSGGIPMHCIKPNFRRGNVFRKRWFNI